jgi:uncharacterized membrane protein
MEAKDTKPADKKGDDKKAVADHAKEVEAGKGMAILSYISILALIPYFTEKTNKFVRYHAIQGLNLAIIGVGYGVVMMIINRIIWSMSCRDLFTCVNGLGVYSFINFIFMLGWLAIGVVSIIGIVNAASGEEKELPVLGKFKFVKK